MKLSKRIRRIAKYTEGFKTMADIGCDHGYLGIHSILDYGLTEVLFTDINEMPLESAKQNCIKENVMDKVKFLLGDGLKPLDKDYEVISICGMGGILIKDILSASLERAKNAKRLILSPNTDARVVREFLVDNFFEIVEEEMIFDYKYYEVIICRYSPDAPKYSELELKYGPHLLKNKDEVFVEYYQKKLEFLEKQYEKVNDVLSKADILLKMIEIHQILINEM